MCCEHFKVELFNRISNSIKLNNKLVFITSLVKRKFLFRFVKYIQDRYGKFHLRKEKNQFIYYLFQILFHSGTDKGWCYIIPLVLTCFRLTMGCDTFFQSHNNCCQFLAFNGVILQCDHQSYFKTPVCGASLLYLCGAFGLTCNRFQATVISLI